MDFMKWFCVFSIILHSTLSVTDIAHIILPVLLTNYLQFHLDSKKLAKVFFSLQPLNCL